MTKTVAGALHAGMQAGGGVAGPRRPVHRGGGQDVGHGGADAVHWVQAERQGKLTGADSKVVRAEQMEIS